MRNDQGIRCVMDVLGEHASDERQTRRSVSAYICLHASVSVKLTSIGALFDRDLCEDNLRTIVDWVEARGVVVEMDMEGRSLVDHTMNVALRVAGEGNTLTLALQAYLDRSDEDLGLLCDHGIRIRLVKGAYEGDSYDFQGIRKRFKELAWSILSRQVPFDVGTHDLELIEWLVSGATRSDVEFGFLKGLSDGTKARLIEDGWKVSEDIPIGLSSTFIF